MSTTTKPHVSFWILTAIALIWNLMGVMAYISQVTMSPEAMAALPETERLLYETIPTWAAGAFAIAVFGGVFGCLLMFFRKSWAFQVLIVSLLGILVQMFHAFFISNSFEVFGPGGTVMPIMVIVIAFALIWYSKKAEQMGWMS